ncbi:hypothetical protein LOTGIDRAFT_86674, partial [Lottia gigantea]
CKSGYHGNKCDTLCPTNCNGGCIQNNGDCVACSDGYWGIKCQSQCPTNYKCEKRCSINCKYHSSITCYKTSGKCNSGCKDTWYGDTCNNKYCPNGTYGLRCSSTCGNCYNQTICHIVTGSCDLELGCEAGFQGPTCK